MFRKLYQESLQSIDTVIFGAIGKSSAINILIIFVKEDTVRCRLAPEAINPAE